MKVFNFLKIVAVAVFSVALLSACMGGEEAPPAKDKDPVEILQESITNLEDVESGDYSFVLNGSISGDKMAELSGTDGVLFNAAFSGAFDVSDEENPLFSFNLDVDLEAGEDEEFVNLETRFLDNVFFFSLVDLSDLGGMLPLEMIEPFMASWWRIDLPEGAIGETFDFEHETTEEEERMKKMFEESGIFGEVEYVGSEKIKGTNTHQYAFALDNDAFLDYVVKSSKMAGTPIRDEELADFSEFLDKASFKGFVGVGQSDQILRQFSGNLVIEEVEGLSMEFDLTLQLSNLNGNVSIVAPEDAVEFDPNMFMGGMF